MSVVGDNLLRIRTSRRISQHAVGLSIGHSTGSYISAIERGRKHPTPDTLSKLAAFLGCSEDDLTRPQA